MVSAGGWEECICYHSGGVGGRFQYNNRKVPNGFDGRSFGLIVLSGSPHFYGKMGSYVVIYKGKGKNKMQGNLAELTGSLVVPLGCKCRSKNVGGCIMQRPLTCVEICAGAGGQALGLALAGFTHVALVEFESEYCKTLKMNRPEWNVICADIHDFDGTSYQGVDLLSGGVPCPPFSAAGKQLGQNDERDLFPEAIRLIREINPRAVMLENVRGFLDASFDEYRQYILKAIERLGYNTQIKLLNASDFGIPQLRPRVVIVGIRKDENGFFSYPEGKKECAPTVGESLYDLMAENKWEGAKNWARKANKIAPTLVGGSKKHGGPDLGPVRARNAWAELGVDGRGVANAAPEPNFEGMPRLTSRMMARIQGFPDTWTFGKKKTAACRMIGNAFPPPVAQAVGEKIKECLEYGCLDSECEISFSRAVV